MANRTFFIKNNKATHSKNKRAREKVVSLKINVVISSVLIYLMTASSMEGVMITFPIDIYAFPNRRSCPCIACIADHSSEKDSLHLSQFRVPTEGGIPLVGKQ